MLEVVHLEFGHTKTLGVLERYSAKGPGLTAIVGRNGCGKSTLLRTLAGLLVPLKGGVVLMGSPMGSLKAKDRARQLALVLTDRISVGGLSVMEVVSLGRHPHPTSHNDEELSLQALEDLGIAHLAHTATDTLSDGERQKVAIARALNQDSPVLLLDEPTAFLDFEARVELMQLLQKVSKTKRVVFSTHDLHLLEGISLDLILFDVGVVTALPPTQARAALEGLVTK